MKRLDDPFFLIEPHRAEGWLERDGGHAIFWQDSGAADGAPILLVHGGPGGSGGPGYRRTLDPARFRIIQFDQRGCGRSTADDPLARNTLAATLEDIEALRAMLGIERWIVAGGSWGSTVAIAYCQAHPDRALGLVSIATWLCRPQDTRWWWQGVRTLFPELWEQFAAPIPEAERHDLAAAYCKRILDDGDEDAAIRLYLYEEGFMHFDAPVAPADPSRGARYGRIFAHYARHDFFVRPGQLLADATRIAHLPALIIGGRYDACTTPDNAYDLARALPRSRLVMVPNAGHYPTEPALARAIAAEHDRVFAMAA